MDATITVGSSRDHGPNPGDGNRVVKSQEVFEVGVEQRVNTRKGYDCDGVVGVKESVSDGERVQRREGLRRGGRG